MNKVARLSSVRISRSLDSVIESLRSFGHPDNALEGCIDEQSGPQEKDNFGQIQLIELANILSIHQRAICDKITTTEENAHNSSLRKLTERRDAALEEKAKLEKRLQEHRAEREKTEAKLKRRLSKVRTDLQCAASKHEEDQRAMDRKDQDEIDAARSQHEETARILAEEKLKMQNQLQQIRKSHRDEELALRSQKDKLEADLSVATRRYEAEASELDGKIANLLAKMKREKSERAKLEEHFDRVDRNARERDKEEEILRKVREMEERADAILDHGAVQLQRLWRGLRDRARLAKAKNKKAKSGKKKGKVKKGKKAK